MRTVLVFLLALGSLSVAQEQGSVIGVVRDSKTHDPIEGVRVLLAPYEMAAGRGMTNFVSPLPSPTLHLERNLPIGAETTTDVSGAFSFRGLAAKRYCLVWQKQNHWAPLDSECSLALVRVIAGGMVQRELELDRSASITARLMDGVTGTAIEGLGLRLHRRLLVHGVEQWIQCGFPKPGKHPGEFQVTDLPPGPYYLETFEVREGETVHQTLPDFLQPRYGRSYYPGVSDIAATTPIVLLAGESRDLDVRLSKRQPRLISVEMSPHIPDEIFVATLERRSIENALESITSSLTPPWDNSVRYNLTDGDYAVTARSGLGAGPLLGATSFSTTGEEGRVQLKVQPALKVHGTIVVDPDSGEAPSAGIYVSLQSADRNHYRESWGASAKAGAKFEITGLLPGRYYVSVATPRGWAASNMNFGSRDAMHQDISLPADETLVITVTKRLGELSGSLVESGRPVDNAIIVLSPEPIPDDARVETLPFAYLHESGDYEFRDVVPGHYRVVPFYGSTLLCYRDLGAIREHVHGYRDVYIQPNRATNGVDFTLNH